MLTKTRLFRNKRCCRPRSNASRVDSELQESQSSRLVDLVTLLPQHRNFQWPSFLAFTLILNLKKPKRPLNLNGKMTSTSISAITIRGQPYFQSGWHLAWPAWSTGSRRTACQVAQASLPNFVQYSLPKNLLPSRMRLTGCGVKTRIVSSCPARKFSDGNALPAIRSQESFCNLPYMTTNVG